MSVMFCQGDFQEAHQFTSKALRLHPLGAGVEAALAEAEASSVEGLWRADLAALKEALLAEGAYA